MKNYVIVDFSADLAAYEIIGMFYVQRSCCSQLSMSSVPQFKKEKTIYIIPGHECLNFFLSLICIMMTIMIQWEAGWYGRQ